MASIPRRRCRSRSPRQWQRRKRSSVALTGWPSPAATGLAPVSVIMMGRLDDWLRSGQARPLLVDLGKLTGRASRDRANPGDPRSTRLPQPGTAAAYRHHLHWTQLSAATSMTIRTLASAVQRQRHGPRATLRRSVAAGVLAELMRIPDFRRAYEPDGMLPEEFDTFGPTVRTLRGFIAACYQLAAAVRDVVLPDPDNPGGAT